MDTLDLGLDEVIGGIAQVPIRKLPPVKAKAPVLGPKPVRGSGGKLQQLDVGGGVKLIGNPGALDGPPEP
jgi:hypothetical protein